jgi:hypothetical protein
MCGLMSLWAAKTDSRLNGREDVSVDMVVEYYDGVGLWRGVFLESW